MTIALLQEQLDSKSDARLRRKIDEQLDTLRQRATTMPPLVFMANETAHTAQQRAVGCLSQPGQVEVTMTPLELINVLADAAYVQRRDQARNKATRDFLDRIAAAGIEI